MSDSKNSKGGAHLSDAHLPKVDEVKSPRPRQAGSMLMASARIEADATCRPGDPLTPVLRKHAATYAERVRTEAPEYMQQVGAGGELVPASMLGENSRALEYRSTVDRPDCVAIEASRDRLELADKAGALEMGLDLADTIQADNSMEKMLVHQMAAAHNSAMRMIAVVNRRVESMANTNQLTNMQRHRAAEYRDLPLSWHSDPDDEHVPAGHADLATGADRRRAAGCGRATPVRHQGRGRRPSGDRSESADPGWGAQRRGR